MLKLNKVDKIYSNKVRALSNINLEIFKDEFIVFLGASGSGKSTLLRVIAGLEELTSGNIYLNGDLINNYSPQKRDIAMVFQQNTLYPHMNIYNNLAFYLKLKNYTTDKIKKIIDDISNKLKIDSLLDRKPNELSGGQRQRVALAKALIKEPSIFLFDEPLSNLDLNLKIEMKIQIMNIHKQLKNEKKSATMIYITHDQVEAMTMGERICILDKGEIIQIDSSTNLYNKPVNLFVAKFLGYPSINLIKGVLRKENDLVKFYIDNIHYLILPKRFEEKVGLYFGKKIILGIRAENIQINENLEKNNTFNAEINFVENLGSELIIYFKLFNNEFISKIKSKILDKNINLYFNTDRIYLFDSETEENILL